MLGWIVFRDIEPYKRIDLEQITLIDFYIQNQHTKKRLYKNMIQNVNFMKNKNTFLSIKILAAMEIFDYKIHA